MELDTSKLSQAGFRKTVSHDNCVVLDIGSGSFPRYIEIRPPGDDGSRMTAIWDGSLDLAVNDKVIAIEYGANPIWRIQSVGSTSDGSGSTRVSKVWESDFGAVALQADADGDIGIGTDTPATKLHIVHSPTATYTGVVPDVADVTVLYLNEADGADIFSGFDFNNTGNSQNRLAYMGGVSESASNRKMSFVIGTDDGTNRAERMRITGDGRVGIGEIAPDTPLHVFETVAASAGIVPSISLQTSRYSTEVGGGVSLDFQVSGGTVVSKIASDVIASGDFAFGIWNWDGSSLQRRITIRENGNVGIITTSPNTRLDIDAGAIEFAEMTAPGGGAANTARLYAVDNGSGKTQLVVVFNTGAAQVLATEP